MIARGLFWLLILYLLAPFKRSLAYKLYSYRIPYTFCPHEGSLTVAHFVLDELYYSLCFPSSTFCLEAPSGSLDHAKYQTLRSEEFRQ